VLIRIETEDDTTAIHALNVSAFETSAEAHFVDTLRAAVLPRVSLGAGINGKVVGHILSSPVTVLGNANLKTHVRFARSPAQRHLCCKLLFKMNKNSWLFKIFSTGISSGDRCYHLCRLRQTSQQIGKETRPVEKQSESLVELDKGYL
jgi:hypothetical protein